MVVTGAVSVLCGQIYGFIDAWSSASDYNIELAWRRASVSATAG
jgi:hypothetical protein